MQHRRLATGERTAPYGLRLHYCIVPTHGSRVVFKYVDRRVLDAPQWSSVRWCWTRRAGRPTTDCDITAVNVAEVVSKKQGREIHDLHENTKHVLC